MHCRKLTAVGNLRYERQQQTFVGEFVDFVDHQQAGNAGLLQRRIRERVVISPTTRFDHQHDRIDVGHRAACRAIHVAIHRPRLLAMDARRIDQQQLPFRKTGNAEHTMSSRLRARRHDADFRPHQRVDQSGFAHIRPADDSH